MGCQHDQLAFVAMWEQGQWAVFGCLSILGLLKVRKLGVTLAGFLRSNSRLNEKLPFSSRASEGKTVKVPYKGDVENTILDILGGLRSTCTYVGAAKLKELSKRATFIRVTQQYNTVFS